MTNTALGAVHDDGHPQHAIEKVIEGRKETAPAPFFVDAHRLPGNLRREWDGKRWTEDDTVKVFDMVRAVCRKAAAEANEGSRALARANTVAAVERFARADRRHAARVDAWDADPWLLNTPGGTVDLRTGDVRPHRASDHITKITAVEPAGECPT